MKKTKKTNINLEGLKVETLSQALKQKFPEAAVSYSNFTGIFKIADTACNHEIWFNLKDETKVVSNTKNVLVAYEAGMLLLFLASAFLDSQLGWDLGGILFVLVYVVLYSILFPLFVKRYYPQIQTELDKNHAMLLEYLVALKKG